MLNYDFDKIFTKESLIEMRANTILNEKKDILVKVIRDKRDEELNLLMFDEFFGDMKDFDIMDAIKIIEKYDEIEKKVKKMIDDNITVRFE